MKEEWIRGQYYSSPHTFSAPVRSNFEFPPRIEILDLTLDENGEGMAGAKMTEQQKLTVAQLLDEIGVARIGVLGYPLRMTPEERRQLEDEVEATKKITRSLKNARPVALANTRDDVDRALAAGAQDVILRSYVSHVQDITPISNQQRIDDFSAVGSYAKGRGLRVGMLAQGVTRADLEDIRTIVTAVHDAVTLDDICLTDTHGVGTPEGMAYLVRTVKEWLGIPIQVHCHNHLGLGLANACASAAAGASIIHTTVHGLGHLGGLAALEEVAVALTVGYGIDLSMNTEKLYQLSKTVASFTGITMPPHKPVVGDRAFTMSNDVFYNLLHMERRRAGLPRINTLPYLPEMVGNRERVYLGKGVTEASLQWALKLVGIDAGLQFVTALLPRVTQAALERGRALNDDEFDRLVADLRQQQPFEDRADIVAAAQ